MSNIRKGKQFPGNDLGITRRDFVKGTLLGTGAALLNMPAPLEAAAITNAPTSDWTGYGGVGDYAGTNGITKGMVDAAHLIRDGKVSALLNDVIDSGEEYDLVIVGGGFAGLSAARTFLKLAKPGQKCLLLDNAGMTGGEAKRNEFDVDGYRIMGAQGSNMCIIPEYGEDFYHGDWLPSLYDELKLPRKPVYREWEGQPELKFARSNFEALMSYGEAGLSTGYYFDSGKDRSWDSNSARNGYVNTPLSAEVRKDLVRFNNGVGKNEAGDDWERWLDGMSYKHYLEQVVGINPEVTRLIDHTMSIASGLGCDAVSALFAQRIGQPAFENFPFKSHLVATGDNPYAHWDHYLCFPGGNDGIGRHALKAILPAAIEGNDSVEAIHNGAIRFETMDRVENPVRIRLSSTTLRIEHVGTPNDADSVLVTYNRNGKLYRVRTRSVVSAIGGWVNKHIVQDLPKEHFEAYDQLVYGSNLIVNVALRNWRFMHKLGVTCVNYFVDDIQLGAWCNIRKPMLIGEHQAPLDPDKPIVLTFYIGYPSPGLTPKEQGAKARWMLLGTSYSDYEQKIRQLMTDMFGSAGFDADRDIAGVVLNRQGHSYVTPGPGFYYGLNDQPAPSKIIQKPFGRIGFGHSEQDGIQEWFRASWHGERATREMMAIVNG